MLHIKENYGAACRSLRRQQLTCQYLDETYTLNFDRFTYHRADQERVAPGWTATVAQYLQAERNLVLKHPGLPCIVTQGKPYKFPLEFVLVDIESKQ